MKKLCILASVLCFLFLFYACRNQKQTDVKFTAGYLLFDIGAESMESIENCKIIHEGDLTEIVLSDEDILLFAHYKYQDNYPLNELDEVFSYPTTKRIQICVGNENTLLYLMQDGCIVVKVGEAGFKTYQADEKYLITPAKYQELIAKYVDN